jgi:hypothetical protein
MDRERSIGENRAVAESVPEVNKVGCSGRCIKTHALPGQEKEQ